MSVHIEETEGTTALASVQKETFLTLGDPATLTDDELADVVIGGFKKMRQYLPYILAMKERFDTGERDSKNRLKTPIKGCCSWIEFCSACLQRTPQTIGELTAEAQGIQAVCPTCNQSFPSKTKLRKHQFRAHQPKKPEVPQSQPADENPEPADENTERKFSGSTSRRESHWWMAELGRFYLALNRAEVVGLEILDKSTGKRIPPLNYAPASVRADFEGATRPYENLDVLFASETEATEILTLLREEVENTVAEYTDQDLATAILQCCGIHFSSLEELQKHRQTEHGQVANGGNFRKLQPVVPDAEFADASEPYSSRVVDASHPAPDPTPAEPNPERTRQEEIAQQISQQLQDVGWPFEVKYAPQYKKPYHGFVIKTRFICREQAEAFVKLMACLPQDALDEYSKVVDAVIEAANAPTKKESASIMAALENIG